MAKKQPGRTRKRKRAQGEPEPSPLRALLKLLFGSPVRRSEVLEHLERSEIELLKAVRYLLDAQIERLERRSEQRRSPRLRKIEVK